MALSRAQGDDVLRYWLAALKLEEALQARPTARTTASTSGVVTPRLDQPTPGQDYFKLPLDAAVAELLTRETQLTRCFDAELCGFFETWLHRQYRRGEDESELSHLLCFPVVHLPRGELGGLLRCPVRLRFGRHGSPPFQAPSRAQRQRGIYPEAPDEARLVRVTKPGEAWPYFIDTRLLRQPLGVATESIDAFFEALRSFELVTGRVMLALLTIVLEDTANDGTAEPESITERAEQLKAAVAASSVTLDAWLGRLIAAVRRLLERASSRARVYPVGIVIDGTQAKTTWHLQRELQALIDGERGRWKLETPLGAYLTGRALPAGEAPQRALFPGPDLSASQRSAAEAFWGSAFSALQGPPGTGKTRLILHLCAETLVQQTETLLSGGDGSKPAVLLIASSNNRAVDNVVEPLIAGEGLALALRAGSQRSCEEQLLGQLRGALSWLKRAASEPALERHAHLTREKALFLEQRDAVERVLAPQRARLARASQRLELLRELEQCAPAAGDEAASNLSVSQRQKLLLAVVPLEKRLQALSKLTEAAPAPLSIRAVKAHYERTAKRALPALRDALAEAELELELPLPPKLVASADVEKQLEAWEDATELGLSRLRELREALVRGAAGAERAERAARLRAELAALGAPPNAGAPPEAPVAEPLSRELFARAVSAREAWARAHAEPLVTALSAAVRTVEQERSLRPLFRNEPEAAGALFRLFAIWGSTLLSLGNCFPADMSGVLRVVIDEAGQCHPAHAVSALLRAESALVIGDVHQLTPVVELSADDEARLLRSCRLATPAELLRPYRVHADAIVSSQSLADRAVEARRKLTDHFRCQPEIIALSDALCDYGLAVHTARTDRSQHAPYLKRPVLLVDLRGEQVRLAGSWCNELEVAETLALVESLRRGGVELEEIAVITPYRGQLEQLRRGFLARGMALESSPELAEGDGAGSRRGGIALGTVHRFQGGERSVVLFSSVITLASSLSFLNARPNLLNVAISRAQHHFVCLGHADVLARGPRSRLLVDRAGVLSRAAYGPEPRFLDR